MGIGLMNRIWWREDLDSSEKLVLLALADRAGDEDGVCWYAVDTIATKSSLQRRSVQRIINRLIERQLLRKMHRTDRSNYYIIPVDRFPYPRDRELPKKERGPEDFMAGMEPDLFGSARGDSGSPLPKMTGDSGSARGDSDAARGDRESPNTISDSIMNPSPCAHAREGGETIHEIVARRWNELAAEHEALAPVRPPLSETRRKAIENRTREWIHTAARVPDLVEDAEPATVLWDRAFETIARSKLLTGQKTAWAPSFDWILGPKNFTKIMEGNYGHGHDRIGTATNDPSQRSAVAAGRAARELVERGRNRQRQASGGPGGHTARLADAHR